MRTFFYLIFLSIGLSLNSFAQSEAKAEYFGMMDDWLEGTISVDNKRVLTGLLRFNYFENILHLKLTDGTIRAFNAQDIQRFDLADEFGRRYFISASLEEAGISKPYFFEILVECKTFALMRLQTAYSYKKQSNATSMTGMQIQQPVPVVVKQRRYYIFDDEGKISLYLLVSDANSGDLFLNKGKRKKVVERDLLEVYMKDDYPDVKKYAKKNSLNVKNESDLFKIFQFYKDIEN
jgi:hypothetical protein